MAFLMCGDTHGKEDYKKVETFFEEHKEYTKDDYLIILGDAGILWDGGTQDRFIQSFYDSLPVTVLWVDGNHENFDLLNKYPVTTWNGGKVQYISDNIIHLMRGQVFNIDGRTFFSFGGGNSVDKMFRTPYVSWWPQEMPNAAEYKEGIKNLEANNWKVDYVISHTCPHYVACMMCIYLKKGEEKLQYYFDDIVEKLEYDTWFFGHWHVDTSYSSFKCLYDDIIVIE